VSATKGQRIGIWAIAIFMFVGTIGSFVAIVLANNNQQSDQTRANELYKAYQKEVADQSTQLSEKYFNTFNQYSSRPAAFDAASVTELQTNDIVVGDGEDITSESSFTAYYIGWNPT